MGAVSSSFYISQKSAPIGTLKEPISARSYAEFAAERALVSEMPSSTPSDRIPATTPSLPSGIPSTTVPPAITPLQHLPKTINLYIPFTAQAPHANWEAPYKEFCEEASALMVERYLAGKAILDADDANTRMLQIKAFEEQRFGYYEDTSAAETAIILREHLGILGVELISNPAIDDIKNALAQGKAVIMPAAGRMLNNPYYRQPGPLYHMLVIKGYTADGKFITNDPGTRRGADFTYDQDTLMRAMHDWNDGDVEHGSTVIITAG